MPKHPACQSKNQSASGAVTTVGKGGYLYGYSIKIGDGGGNTIIQWIDGTTSGTVKWEDGAVKVDDLGDKYITYQFPTPMLFSSDIFMKIVSGDNAVVKTAYVELDR